MRGVPFSGGKMEHEEVAEHPWWCLCREQCADEGEDIGDIR